MIVGNHTARQRQHGSLAARISNSHQSAAVRGSSSARRKRYNVQGRSHDIACGHESLYSKHVQPAMLAKSSRDLQSLIFIIRQGDGLSLVLRECVSVRERR